MIKLSTFLFAINKYNYKQKQGHINKGLDMKLIKAKDKFKATKTFSLEVRTIERLTKLKEQTGMARGVIIDQLINDYFENEMTIDVESLEVK